MKNRDILPYETADAQAREIKALRARLAESEAREKALREAWTEWFSAAEELAELESNNDTTKRFDRALMAQEIAEEKARAELKEPTP